MKFLKKFMKEAKILSAIVFVILAFRSIFFEPFHIPTGSMIPTLRIGDYILVSKMAYGLKLPFSDYFSNPVYLKKSAPPKRGDVVVFKFPKDKKIDYIKRIVALPGDTVEIKNKIVFVNDKPININEIAGEKILADIDEKYKVYNLKFFEIKDDEYSHVIQQNNDSYYKVDFDKMEIPEGHYFVMGDNRDFSYDSRFWGLVPFENIKGKAMMVWFSMKFSTSGNDFKFRPWRIGTSID